MDTFLIPRSNHRTPGISVLWNLIHNSNWGLQSRVRVCVCVCMCVCIFSYYLMLPSLEKQIIERAVTRAEPAQAEESFASHHHWNVLDSEMRLGLGRKTSAVRTLLTIVSGKPLSVLEDISELQTVTATVRVATTHRMLVICQALCWVLKSVQFLPPSHRWKELLNQDDHPDSGSDTISHSVIRYSL